MRNGAEFGLRVVALVIDLVIVGVSVRIATFLGNTLASLGKFPLLDLYVLFMWLTFIIWLPLFYFLLTTGFWGRTVGKWVCKFRVIDAERRQVTFLRGISREGLKYVMLVFMFPFGPAIALVQSLLGYKPFYDSICKTDVEYIGLLTETQRNWRQVHDQF